MATEAFHHFQQQGSGQLAGISSVAALRGSTVPAYAASKAFVANYLEGLRIRARKLKLPIDIIDIRPGYVETPLTHGQPGMFWVADAATAAWDCLRAIERRKRVAYITPRWALIAVLLRLLPGWLYERIAVKG